MSKITAHWQEVPQLQKEATVLGGLWSPSSSQLAELRQMSPGDPGWPGPAIPPQCWNAATSVVKPALFDHHQTFSSSFCWCEAWAWKKECFQLQRFTHFTHFLSSLWLPSEISHCVLSPIPDYFPSILWQRAEALSKRDIKVSAQGVGLTQHSHPVATWAATRAASGQHIHSHCNPGVSPKM